VRVTASLRGPFASCHEFVYRVPVPTPVGMLALASQSDLAAMLLNTRPITALVEERIDAAVELGSTQGDGTTEARCMLCSSAYTLAQRDQLLFTVTFSGVVTRDEMAERAMDLVNSYVHKTRRS